MSGDKVIAELGTCPCGRSGPTILDDISRFSDLADGDKITVCRDHGRLRPWIHRGVRAT